MIRSVPRFFCLRIHIFPNWLDPKHRINLIKTSLDGSIICNPGCDVKKPWIYILLYNTQALGTPWKSTTLFFHCCGSGLSIVISWIWIFFLQIDRIRIVDPHYICNLQYGSKNQDYNKYKLKKRRKKFNSAYLRIAIFQKVSSGLNFLIF